MKHTHGGSSGVIIPYERPVLTGDVACDVAALLAGHGRTRTLAHCRQVADSAAALAVRFGLNAGAAAAAGWLHDVSAVIAPTEQVSWATRWAIEVLAEEAQAPVTLHQKLSAWIAENSFGVTDPAILSAVGCHTTLRPGATYMDKIVFLADKMSWDQVGRPPYPTDVQGALAASLDAGVGVYLAYLWRRRESLAVVHPWFEAAYRELGGGE